jgi:hypothetical protein
MSTALEASAATGNGSAIAANNPDIDRALSALKARGKEYERYERYYNGEHPLSFATEKFRSAFGGQLRSLADNMCTAPVDALADRLEITAFSVEEGDASAGEAAWKLWEANRMDRRAGEVHTEALREGDAYVIVWPDDEGVPRILPQGAALMTVQYDPEKPGVVMWAAKCWTGDDKRTRLTMYYPDRLEKYITRSRGSGAPTSSSGSGGKEGSGTRGDPSLSAKNFVRREVLGEQWPVNNQYGTVPVFHFANNAGVGRFGTSELRNVTPLQDALNKAMADMLVAMEFVAFPQRWATGIEIEIDQTTGAPIQPFKAGADRVWAVGDKDAAFGQFQQGQLGEYLAVQDSLRLEIARVTGTPLHYMSLMSDPPSGEALKTLEARFVKKCLDRQTSFGNVWEDVLALALRMSAEGPDSARLQAEWVAAAPQSELELADTGIQWQTLGVPDEVIWEKLGFTDAQITKWLEAKAAAAAQMQATMAAATAVPGSKPSTAAMMMPAQSGGLPASGGEADLGQNVRVAAPAVGGTGKP